MKLHNNLDSNLVRYPRLKPGNFIRIMKNRDLRSMIFDLGIIQSKLYDLKNQELNKRNLFGFVKKKNEDIYTKGNYNREKIPVYIIECLKNYLKE